MGQRIREDDESAHDGQLVDGLELRAESWERTAEYLRSGFIEGDFIVEECSKPEEADDIAANYRSIITSIRPQMEAQGQSFGSK